MKVEQLKDGSRAYITPYGEMAEAADSGELPPDNQDPEELKQQSLAGLAFAEEMGAEVPRTVHEGDEVIQQEVGGPDTETWTVRDAPDRILEKVDEDEFTRKMAIKTLAGDPDTRTDDLRVGEDGTIYLTDFDRTGAESYSEFGRDGDIGSMTEYAATIGTEIGQVNDDFKGDKTAHQREIGERAINMAKDLKEEGEVDEVLNPVRERDQEIQAREEVAEEINENIERLADEEFSPLNIDRNSGASDSEVDDKIPEL
jgi:hypothetical protein